jgi:hypothetical protein
MTLPRSHWTVVLELLGLAVIWALAVALGGMTLFAVVWTLRSVAGLSLRWLRRKNPEYTPDEWAAKARWPSKDPDDYG